MRLPTLDQSKVTIGVAALVVAQVAVGTWVVSSVIGGFRQDIQQLKQEQYSLPAAAEQALRMAIENPGMSVPDPRDPTRVIRVNSVKQER